MGEKYFSSISLFLGYDRKAEASQHRCLLSPGCGAAYRARGASRASRTGSSQCCRGSSSWCRGHHWWCAAGGCPASGGHRPRWLWWTLSGEAECLNLKRRERRVSGKVMAVLISVLNEALDCSPKLSFVFFPPFNAGVDKTILSAATQVEQTEGFLF